MDDLSKITSNQPTSEEPFRALVENVPDTIVLVDREGKILYLNRIPLQFSKVQLIGMNISKLTIPQNQPLYYNAIADVLTTDLPVSLKTSAPDNTGRIRWYETRWVPVKKGSQIDSILVIVSDITDQVESETKVKDSERLLLDIFTSIQDGISILDAEMRILRVNPVMEKWYAHKMPLVGKKCYDAYHDRQLSCEVCPTRKTLANGQSAYDVVPKMGPDREIVGWLDLFSFPLIDTKTGELKGVIEYVRDITERRWAEEKLRDSEAKYRILFESNVVAVGIADIGGNLIEVNESWIQLFGYPQTEISALNLFSLFQSSNTQENLIQNVSLDGQAQNLDLLVHRKNSEELWVNLSMRRLNLQGIERFLIICINIDAKKRAEQSLQRLYETTLQISEMKTNLITFASHELKTPLVPILGWVEVLQKALAKGDIISKTETKEIYDALFRSAQRLEKIVDNFLDIGRLDSGRLEIQVKTHSATKLMQNALDAISNLIQSQKMHILNKIDEIALCVDGFRIEQVFINILTNAIKYSPPGKEVKINSEIDQDKQLISIIDQGYGFTPEEMRDIWQPFSGSYLKKKSTTFLTGTGVGLYLSKGLVESHGGRIEIESPGKDQGTIVKIWLPLAQPQHECSVS